MSKERLYKVGRFELILPADHCLDLYQARFPLYDRALADISRFVFAKYPDGTAIDIGANIGDTAAAICEHRDVPVLCIEGNPAFTSIFRRNIARLPRTVELVESLVGEAAGMVAASALKTGHGTASLAPTETISRTGGDVPVLPLNAILTCHPRFAQPRLLKSDTDGSDFEILLSSADVLGQCRPVLYFEYDPTFRKDGMAAADAAIQGLVAAGYRNFLVYDNFGHFLEFIDRDPVDRLRDLSRFLFSNLFFGRQVFYFDICATVAADGDIAISLRDHARKQVDHYISGWARAAVQKPG